VSSSFSDRLRTAVELASRQLYFRSRLIRRLRQARGAAPAAPTRASIDALRSRLEEILPSGGLAMAHVSTLGVQLDADDTPMREAPRIAATVVALLRECVGVAGTLVMPTHPLYPAPPWDELSRREDGRVLTFDPLRTPTSNGLANELFRRGRDTTRSCHPLQTVSAAGPLASVLLQSNLHSDKPLPHGPDSPYFRFSKRRGIVVGVGLPLLDYCTIVHTAEDARPGGPLTADFYRERRFIVREGVRASEWIVHERRPLYSRAYSEVELRRDLLREGILHEGCVGSVRVDWLNAGDLLDYMLERNKQSTYPYRWTGLARAA